MVTVAAAVLVTLIAVLGGIGALPSVPASAEQAHGQTSSTRPPEHAAVLADSGSQPSAEPDVEPDETPDVPADSGSGRRVVFDMSDQRVWLVAPKADEDVALRTYLVSGSVTGNLDPGTYSVYSKSLRAWGVDDSGSMRYMVRFAHGSRAAIGFHDIPVSDGALVQSRAELGTPRSHGCIRQARPDARALWRFAPRGTTVVVTA